MAFSDKEREMLKTILEKNSKNIDLTPEEDKFRAEVLDKAIRAKNTMSKKDWQVITGDEFRAIKKQIANTPAPKQQGFKGGYDKDSEQLDEASDMTVDEAKESPKAEEPTRPYPEATTKQVTGIENDDPSGKVKAEYTDEEYADTDNKQARKFYEQDRLADMTEGRHTYADSFRIGDLVTREIHGGKELGKVIGKSSNGGLVVLWKTSMVQTFENPDNLGKIYKGRLITKADYKEVEDEEVSPPVKKEAAGDGIDLAQEKKVKKGDMEGAYDSMVEKDPEDQDDDLDIDEVVKLADQIIALGEKVIKLEEKSKQK